MKKYTVLLSLVLLSFAAIAQPIATPPYYVSMAVPAAAPIPRVVFPTIISGNTATFGPVTANAANAANFSFGAAANGAVFANTGAALATAGGNSVAIGVSSIIAKPSVLGAVGRFIGRGMPLINTATALYSLARELQVIVKNDDNGLPSFSEIKPTALGDCKTTFANVLAQNSHYVVTADGSGYCTVVELSYDGSTTYITSGYPVKSTGLLEAPITPAQFLDRLDKFSSFTPDSALAPLIRDVIKSGIPVVVEPTAVAGPQSSPGAVQKRDVANDPATNPSPDPAKNPNTSTTTQTTTNNYQYGGTTVTTTTTTNNNTVNNFNGRVSQSSTTTDAPVLPEPAAEIVTCGLPGKPPCKIDETGTPEPDTKLDPTKVTEDAFKKLKEFSEGPEKALPALPSLNWAFRLPTGCVPFSIPAFSPFLQTIDICQFQPMFHDIMGMVWTIGGLFGAISLFWRNTLSQN